jgi:flagellin-like hook-associated protein FlgL
MTILSILSSALATVVVVVVGYFGARALNRALANKANAEAGHAEATAEKTAVDGYDLLTGRLEARLTASEKREAELMERLEKSDRRATEALERLEKAEDTIRDLRAEVGRLTNRLASMESEGTHHA